MDLFAGLGALLTGVAWQTDAVALGPIAPALAVPIWMAFRRSVVVPALPGVLLGLGGVLVAVYFELTRFAAYGAAFLVAFLRAFPRLPSEME